MADALKYIKLLKKPIPGGRLSMTDALTLNSDIRDQYY